MSPTSLARFSPPLSRTIVWIVAALAAVMLIAMIAYPMGYDQATFSIGGEMVLKQGAIPYRDILDTKPPLIFYIYALPTLLFGHHPWSVRALDILFQIGCGYYLVRILRRSVSAELALFTVAIGILIYVGAGFWMTAQAESFALLPSVLLADFTLRFTESDRTGGDGTPWRNGTVVGFAASLLFLFKFTFLVGWAAAILFVFLSSGIGLKRQIKFVLASAATFALVIGAYVLFLAATGGLHRFFQGMQWVAQYAAIDPLFARSTISEKYFQLFPDRLVFSYSLTFLLAGMWGIARYLRRTDAFGAARGMLGLFALSWGFHLIGVLSERKMFPYHYTRGFWALTPFIAIGITTAIVKLREEWHGASARTIVQRIATSVLLAGLTLVGLFYSPIVKIFSQSVPWLTVGSTQKATEEVHRRIKDYYADEQLASGNYLKQHMTDRDRMFLWGNDMAVYFWADKLPPIYCLTATPLRTSWTPPDWQTKMIHDLDSIRPKYFVAEFGDEKNYITGSARDSYEALEAWPALQGLLTTNYNADTTIGHYRIYRLRS